MSEKKDETRIARRSRADLINQEKTKPPVARRSVACHLCCKFAMALYPDLPHSSKDKYLLPVIQSSLISIMMQTATLRSD